MMRSSSWVLLPTFLIVFSAQVYAQGLELNGSLVQGGMAIGIVPPGTTVTLGEKKVHITADGQFVIGFGRDAAPEAVLHLQFPDGRAEQRRLSIDARDYDIQRIEGLPPRMVTPPPEVLDRIRREGAMISAVRGLDSDVPHFLNGFEWPTHGPITGVYGSQRILNGEPRRPHFGLDIAPPEGTPVVAPAPGVVALAESDLYYTGGTVMIDHGYGITSVLMHLKTVDAEVGAEVAKGDPIGTVGATGRVTGPHLDWRINWFDIRLDPGLLLDLDESETN